MVATISARGGAKAALAYYSHLGADNYYTRDGEPPGRWAGRGADQLSLEGPVTRHEFEAALIGRDPKTGAQLVARGGRESTHSAGWDMTFSAPKSVSVLWALSSESERQVIEEAQKTAVLKATKYLEQNAAWARRGKGGRMRERTAGLLTAQFDHHTSRDLDPQLHTHVFVFNLAPRKDGSWGAILSKELYFAQKQAGLEYRNELANGLEREGFALERTAENFRIAAIPREIEQAFSKRRMAIEEAARTHGYSTPRGMELATLRTRRAKEKTVTRELFSVWREEAKALGFKLKAERVRALANGLERQNSAISRANLEPDSVKIRGAEHLKTRQRTPKIPAQMARIMNEIQRLIGPSYHGGSSRGPNLKQGNRLLEREYER
jgi:conjugative relaxase-like TrwC/TraI family protein